MEKQLKHNQVSFDQTCKQIGMEVQFFIITLCKKKSYHKNQHLQLMSGMSCLERSTEQLHTVLALSDPKNGPSTAYCLL
jgi:hypothetical protein